MHRVLLACLITSAACALARPPPPAPPRHTDLGLRLKRATLENGLRVVLVQDPHANEVQVTMRYRVGAGDDLERPGIAHLVEHLMFQQVLGAQTLFAHLEDNATYFNAMTTYDATTYVSRARPDFLDKLLSIEAVRLQFRCTSITDSVFEREREVVIQEAKQRDFYNEILATLHSAVFPDGHPYRGSGGTTTTVAAITRAQACTFADAYYAPENAVLVISGNLSNDRVETALGKFLARVPKRVAAAPAKVPAARQRTVELAAPIDSEVVLISWPLPDDPAEQLVVRKMAQIAAAAVNDEVKGPAVYVELGDVRAPVVGIAVAPSDGESIADVLEQTQDVCQLLPSTLEAWSQPKFVFDMLQQNALYEQFASLEDGSDRDVRLAEHVLAGRDPSQALAAELSALRNLDRREVAATVRRHLAFSNASVATLKPKAGNKEGRRFEVRPATHDIGQRRHASDPSRAHQADTSIAVPSVAIKTRVLPNGLKVVLLPLTTVPTIDMRLVFAAGTADEPASKRGAALVAAHALTFDMHYLNDVMNFMAAGAVQDVEVTRDGTSFIVRGLDMHLDYLLAGLRRWTVDGRYARDADTLVQALHDERKRADEDTAVTDAWQAARYGVQHPYARAGFTRLTAAGLTVEDAETFRRSFFAPDNATLVIAGHFDVALADRWIDFLFAEWKGHTRQRRVPPAKQEPASLAKLEELTQLQLRLALPAQTGSRAQLLVAAALLDDIAGDVRHQLAATYGLDAALDETRAASSFVIDGWVEPARAGEVVQLMRDRVARLRDDPDAGATAFVTARARVIAALSSVTGNASLLAARAQTDIALARPPLSDLQTAKEVQALTFEQMKPVLAQLDLARAAILMRGPDQPVKSAFQVLGREPTIVRFDQAAHDKALEAAPSVTPAVRAREQYLRFGDIEYSITEQGPALRSPIEVAAYLSYSATFVNNVVPPSPGVRLEDGPGALTLGGELGLRFRQRFSAGLHASIGYAGGTYPLASMGIEYDHKPYSIVPIDLDAYIHLKPVGKLWGGFVAGLHVDGLRFDTGRAWTTAFGYGLEIGRDLWTHSEHTISVVARATGSRGSDIALGTLGLGVAYRH